MSELAIVPKPAPYMPTKAKEEDQNTPVEVLEPVRRIFGGHIDFDPCGNPGSIVEAKRQVWLPKWGPGPNLEPGGLNFVPPPNAIIGDGLELPWSGSTFVNPPYSWRLLAAFMRRAREAARRGVPVIMLCKAKTGLKAWHESVPAAPAVCFLGHRLTFHGCEESAPFDCALIIWTESRELVHRFALELDGKLGDVMFHR